MSPCQTPTFNVSRHAPELIPPAKPTPNGLKDLSDCDDMPSLRVQVPFIQFFRQSELAQVKDPAKVIKDAIAKALVVYYPLAGRLREVGSDRKLFVDCTGEGVVFVEADADVSVDEFGDVLHPPFPGVGELLCDTPGSLIGSPLLHFQVTKLKCGGFILATLLNHIAADGVGWAQFMTAVSEIARGLAAPSIQPVWDRHILRARNPPHVAFDHHEYDREPGTTAPFFNRADQIVERAFLFDPPAVSALRHLVAPHVPHCSTFELIVATMWRARALSLNLDPTLNVRVTFPVNARDKFNPPIIIPNGYYGNVVATPVAMATVAELQANSVVRAVELVKKAKNEVSGDYMRSMMDVMGVRGRPPLAMGTTLFITDMRRVGVHELDYGWGRAAYGGPAKGNESAIPGFLSFLQPVRNRNGGECGIVVPMSLPEPAMNLLVYELDVLMGRASVDRDWRMTTATLFRWARK